MDDAPLTADDVFVRLLALQDAIVELDAAVAAFEPCADFRLLRAARAVVAAAVVEPAASSDAV